MDFVAVVDQVIALLRQRGRLTYGTLKRQFELDDAALEDLKEELMYGQRLAVDEDKRVLVWIGDTAATTPPASGRTPALDTSQVRAPLAYTPPHLAEKILTSRSALEGERKQVTVLFADLKGSMELLAERDPEEARQLLDPVLERMMAAVHRYEGTVNQVMGDGIMALFGAPLAHEDHAVRACYAALAMQTAVQQYAAEVQRSHGVPLQMRVGLNAGEVVVRAIGNDLHMDYSAIGQTTHLAARMEQMAMPGSSLITPAVLGLAEGYVQVRPLGPVSIKGLDAPMEVFELVGVSGIRRRLQAAAVRGLTRFVGRDTELVALGQALERAEAGHGQVVAVVGEAGMGKSRLVYECVHSPRTHGWRVLESALVSYGKATPYFPVIDLLKHYVHVEDGDELRTIRARVTGQVLTLDETLQLAEAVAHPSSLMWACYGIGLLCLRQGDLPRALPLLERAMGICQEADLPLFVPRMAAALGTTYTLAECATDAVPLLTQAMEQTTVPEMMGHQALCSLPLGEAHMLAGRLEKAHALAERALAFAREHQERGHEAYALRLLGEIVARRDPLDIDQAVAHYQHAFVLAAELGMRPLQAHCYRGLGTLYAATGQREQARAALSTAMALYRDMDMAFWLPQTETALAQVQ